MFELVEDEENNMKQLKIIGMLLMLLAAADAYLYNSAGFDIYKMIGINLTGYAGTYSALAVGFFGLFIYITVGQSEDDVAIQASLQNGEDIIFTSPVMEKRTKAEFNRQLVLTKHSLKIFLDGSELSSWDLVDIREINVGFASIKISATDGEECKVFISAMGAKRLKTHLKEIGLL